MRLVTLKDLLEAKADPNIADNAGRTALSWAASNPNGITPFAVGFRQLANLCLQSVFPH